MKEFIEKLEREMHQGLATAAIETETEMQKAERSFQVAEMAMLKLKEFISGHEFKDKTEEIYFFKEVKPRFQKHLLFFIELIQVETYDVSTTKKDTISYYRQVIERLKLYFEKNKLLYAYYKRKHSQEDYQLFLRDTDCVPLFPEYNLDLDPKFSTANSQRFAKFYAYEMLIDYLEKRIYNLKNAITSDQPGSGYTSRLKWQGSKSDLVQLGKGLYATGVCGKASFKEIMATLEFAFNIPSGTNYWRVWSDVLILKKEPLPFLQLMLKCTMNQLEKDLK